MTIYLHVIEVSRNDSGANLDSYLFIHFLIIFFIKLLLVVALVGFHLSNYGVALTFFLTALLALFARFALVLAAELQNANGEEDSQNHKANQHPHRL